MNTVQVGISVAAVGAAWAALTDLDQTADAALISPMLVITLVRGCSHGYVIGHSHVG